MSNINNKYDLSNISVDILEIIFNSNNECYSYKDIIRLCLICKNININLLKNLYLTNLNVDNIYFTINCYKIIELNLMNTNIQELSFLKLCINIKILCVKNITNDNLLNIKFLINLQNLTLNNIIITNFSFIIPTKIKLLTLFCTNINDTKPLQFCNYLNKIYMRQSYLNDYYNLSKCKSLSKLYLYNSQIHFHDMRYLTKNNIKIYNNKFK